jgi:BetI-type transcriptional repressor, C-terminal
VSLRLVLTGPAALTPPGAADGGQARYVGQALAAHEPVIAAAVRAADTRTHEQLEGLFAAGEWPVGTDPALAARLFTAGLYGLMAQWHLAPGSFSWEAAAAALADGTGGGVSPADD